MPPRPICETVELPAGAPVMTDWVRHAATAPAAASFPHFHDVGELVLFRQARGAFFADGKEQAVEAGSVVYVPPMRLHDFQLAAGVKEWVLVQMDPFTAERLWEPLAPARAAPVCIRPGRDDAERLWSLALWLSELAPGDTRISPLLQLIVAEARRHAPTPGDAVEVCSPPHVERLRPALERLRRDPSRAFSAAEAAQACNLSTAYFCRLFKTTMGSTFGDYVRTHQLHLAARRLLESEAQVAQIAYSVGFASPSHFGAAFVERFGLTPRAYRAAHRLRREAEGGGAGA